MRCFLQLKRYVGSVDIDRYDSIHISDDTLIFVSADETVQQLTIPLTSYDEIRRVTDWLHRISQRR